MCPAALIGCPEKRTPQEDEEMANLMSIAAERPLTHDEMKAYYTLLGYDESWAEQLAQEGFPLE